MTSLCWNLSANNYTALWPEIREFFEFFGENKISQERITNQYKIQLSALEKSGFSLHGTIICRRTLS
ncbi:unnamed protein product [Allacma fusca]|uniref:Uncharacterized protein n=1 Tax=Allacma fusca TaxID=39272 RepID=A0A8J2JIN0_9HEXA|nr:unnamed protein product [Allacma fusca]